MVMLALGIGATTAIFTVVDESLRLSKVAWQCDHGPKSRTTAKPVSVAALRRSARDRNPDASGIFARTG
jgi:hypothetical protein